MTSIEVIVSRLEPELQKRSSELFTLEVNHKAPEYARIKVDRLRNALARSAALSQALYTHLPLSAHPDGVGASADDLRYALMSLPIDAADFDEEGAADAASQIESLNQELERALRPVLLPSTPDWVAAAKAIPRPPTKGREEALLAEKGFSGPLLEALVKAGGAKRHDARLQYLLAAVPAAVEAALKAEGVDSNVHGLAALVMHADAAGVGGTADIEGAGTARPALLSLICGSGRKQAGDGAAWSSAISAAAYQELPTFTPGSHVIYDPLMGAVVAYDSFEGSVSFSYRCPAAVAEALIGPRYLRAAALRAATAPVRTDREPQGIMLSAAFEWADEAMKAQAALGSARTVLGWTY